MSSDWLNYQHLFYFRTVAREGTIAAAAEELRLAPSTISEQIGRLEESLGRSLFRRVGRNNVLTDTGEVVLRYADEIFGLGRELLRYVHGHDVERLHLRVGLSMVVPKQVAARLLELALNLDQPVHLICREGPTHALLADLARHQLDVVLTDAPLGPDSSVRAFNHLLVECGVTWLGTPELVATHGDAIPTALDGAPILLPTAETVLRRQLEHWLERRGVHPQIVAEFDDSALMKVFGQHGRGFFPIPSLVADEVAEQYGVLSVGEVDDEVRERFYAVSVERQLAHPAVVAIAEAAGASDER